MTDMRILGLAFLILLATGCGGGMGNAWVNQPTAYQDSETCHTDDDTEEAQKDEKKAEKKRKKSGEEEDTDRYDPRLVGGPEER